MQKRKENINISEKIKCDQVNINENNINYS